MIRGFRYGLVIKMLLAGFCLPQLLFWSKPVLATAAISAKSDIQEKSEKSQRVEKSEKNTQETDATQKKFQEFLLELKSEALSRGIDETVINQAFANLQYHPKIVKSDRTQAEQVESSAQYITLRARQSRVILGKKYWQEHKKLIQEISDYYGVAPQILLALWAVESDYGANRPKQPVIAALASLAFDMRRRDFFRSELFVALEIAQELGINPNVLLGSWAGAMGQIQFMPSSYKKFAVRWDARHKTSSAGITPRISADIWYNNADILASIANYLSQNGWRAAHNNAGIGNEVTSDSQKPDLSKYEAINVDVNSSDTSINDHHWGVKIIVPPHIAKIIDSDPSKLDKATQKSWQEWSKMGIKLAENSNHIPHPERQASLIRARVNEGDYYLVYDNFHVFLRWNRSILFGLVVGELANRIADNS